MRNRTLSPQRWSSVPAGALALTACSSSKKSQQPAAASTGGGGSSSSAAAAAQTYKIGFIGAAVRRQRPARHQRGQRRPARRRPGQRLGQPTGSRSTWTRQDSEGDPAKAPAAATALIAGPRRHRRRRPGLLRCDQGRRPELLRREAADADRHPVGDQRRPCRPRASSFWHRIIPNDNVEGTQAADWLARKAKKVFVVDDLTAYGKGVADAVATELKAKGSRSSRQGVDATTHQDYSAIAQHDRRVRRRRAVLRRLRRPGRAARQGAAGGRLQRPHRRPVTAASPRVFTKSAGAAGNGWYFTCGCQDATIAPAAKAFTAAYQAKFNTAAVDLLAGGLRRHERHDPGDQATPRGRHGDPDAVDDAVTSWTTRASPPSQVPANGEVALASSIVNLYQQKNGAIVVLGDINKTRVIVLDRSH